MPRKTKIRIVTTIVIIAKLNKTFFLGVQLILLNSFPRPKNHLLKPFCLGFLFFIYIYYIYNQYMGAQKRNKI
jgi:hypothetical protein